MTAKLACAPIRLSLLRCQVSLYLSETIFYQEQVENMICFSSTFYAKLTALSPLSEISTQMKDSIDGMKIVN